MSVFEKISPEHPILIQGAMENEIDVLTEALEDSEFVSIDGFEFYKGTIAGKAIVISQTHIGKVNATLATYIGIEKFTPAFIVNQGTAGAHNKDLNTGDIVIGKQIINIDAPDLDVKALLEGKALVSSEPMNVELQKNGTWDWTFSLSSDKELSEFFLSAPYNGGTILEGTIVSSDGWTQTKEGTLALNERYGSDCEEMESFVVAQVCALKNIPFIVFRVISNSNIKETTFEESSPALCQNYVIDVLSRQ